MDTCGTGGDRSCTINASTLAALVVAGAGAPVCKHGNRAASSRCGSADLLEALGVVVDLSPEGVVACIEEAGMGFCFAPRFHPALRHAGPTRRELGVPTVFNFLGPLANPSRLKRQSLGVSDPRMAEKMAGVLLANGAERAMVVFGHDGLDEVTTTTTSTVIDVRDGGTTTFEIDPAALGLSRAEAGDLVGGDTATNAGMARGVLDGRRGPHREFVMLNAAVGLVAAGLVDDVAARARGGRRVHRRRPGRLRARTHGQGLPGPGPSRFNRERGRRCEMSHGCRRGDAGPGFGPPAGGLRRRGRQGGGLGHDGAGGQHHRAPRRRVGQAVRHW